MEHTTRAHGSGSIYFSQGRWVAALTIPTPRGERRKVRRFSRLTFCECLRVLTEQTRTMSTAYSDPDQIRRDRLAVAREQGTHTGAEWWALVRRVAMRCAYCGIKTTVLPPFHRPDGLAKDHAVPLARGGSDSIENLAVACRGCNAEKGTMTADEYIEWRSQNG